MAKGNAYLAKQKEEKRRHINAGWSTAWQTFWDYLCIVLHDPEVMSKDTFGRERLQKIMEAISTRYEQLHDALTLDKEADYYQEKMDDMLREIWGDDLAPFKERYPYIHQLDYSKQHRAWK